MTEPTGSRATRHQPLLRVSELHKRFGETQALRGADLEGSEGEIHAIVGENGAGKSTLMRILAGALQPDSGELLIDGQAVELASPLDARSLGIWAVYQEFSLVGHLGVAENLLLGRLAGKGRTTLRPKDMLREARAMIDELGFDLDLRARVDDLSVSQRQMVEIAKALAERPRILILDEPSAVLAREQLERLFGLLRDLVAGGSLVLYVSHRFDEIFEIADRITVLKDGQHVTSLRPSDTDQRSLINLMVGRDVADVFPERIARAGEEQLVVEGLGRPPDLHDVSFRLAAGEVVGLFGLVGSGRTELARALFGAEPATAGHMTLAGRPYEPRHPSDGLAAGLAYLTEDRGQDGLLLTASVRTNMTLAVLRQLTDRSLLRPGREEAVVAPQMESLSIRAPRSSTPVRHLSGGNQQKVLFARALLTDARVLVLDEPTRGVDVPTRIQIYSTIARLAEAGAAILIISSELVEILGLSDRILVMRDGRLVAELPGATATESSVLAAASGVAA